jgi:L-tyrosine peroxygenase
MQRGGRAVIDRAHHAWDYGGYPYAVVPLILPDPGIRYHTGERRIVEEQHSLLQMETAAGPHETPESADVLFWFRWIIGNQAVTALWQMLDDELALVLAEELPTAARNAEALLETYSALLIYAGSPTREVYHRLIRPAMALQHRSFSGRWAQDYVPVMGKLQALRKAYRAQPRPEPIESLINASKRNHRTHVAVAAKLVPDDDSLLRAHDGGSLGQPNPELVLLYDAFYSTVRTLVPRENVASQFLTRLRAILWDLRTNGLYPQEASSRHECPMALWTEGPIALEEDLASVLLRGGEAAMASLRLLPAPM